jgi:eukaryotic-like serine/threonine-protein kinase
MNSWETTAPVRAGDVFAGKFVIGHVIGVGASGVIVSADHAQLGEKVVLKFLRPEVADRSDVVTRFLREARAAVRIRGEHVARVIDVGTTDRGLPYIVMEHLDGCDLRKLLRARGALPVADAVEYVTQACLAMIEAHAAGVVHRDLKPSNLFLTHRADGSSLIKVLDFGISKLMAEANDQTDLTSTSGLLGSPIYISPEQAQSARSVDARTDVWSLGVILHHLTTGKPPFAGDSLAQVLSAILFDPPRRLTAALPDAPRELEAIVLRCLEKDVEKRMPSAAHLALALAPWAQAESRVAIARIARTRDVSPLVRADLDEERPAPRLDAIAPWSDRFTATRSASAGMASGRRLPGPAGATWLAGAALLVGVAATCGYLAHRRVPIGSPVPVAGRSITSVRRAEPAATSHHMAAAIAVPSDDALAVSLAPLDESTSAVASEQPHRTPRPSKPNEAVTAPTTAAAVATKRTPSPLDSSLRIDPASLTFDLGAAPAKGQSPR